CAVSIPSVEPLPYCGPIAELRWQITPRGAGTQYPENPVESVSAISGRTTGASRFREAMLDPFPLVVGESMTYHPCVPPCVVKGSIRVIIFAPPKAKSRGFPT